MDLADEPTPASDLTTPPAGVRIVSLIADDGREPPGSTTDADATGAWAAASAPWHPALLAVAADLPRFEDVALPTDPEPGEIRLVAHGQMGRLPAGYRDQAQAAGVPILEVVPDRLASVRALLDEIRTLDPSLSLSERPIDDLLVHDYFALGSGHWWIRDLTLAMGHVDTLSRSSLLREATSGARAWAAGDETAAENHLRAGFELLAQARERFYPMDGYLLDFCLLDPTTPADQLAPLLDARRPFTLLASSSAVDRFATARPDLAERLRGAIDDGWADVIGGAWSEVDEPFLPWSSLAWQFTQGSVGYRRHLDERNVETLARRRFGLYPQLPQVARRFGLRYAWLIALDEGRFPVVPESKRQWAAPDGTTLESITRPPLAADRPGDALRVAWRMARSMKDDSVATLPLAHWPEPVAPWFADLRRSGKYAAILGRWVTANDYFHFSDRPFDEVCLAVDDLSNAYLTQAVARREPSPIARRAEHARTRARFDMLTAAHALAASLRGEIAEPLDPDLETRVETDPGVTVRRVVEDQLNDQANQLARQIVGADSGGVPGYLVFNFLGVPRRMHVAIEGGPPVANAGQALRASQRTATSTTAVVEVAPFGFAWFAANQDVVPGSAVPLGSVSVRGQTMTHESILATVDPATGGLRGINAVGEESPRLGQQLVIHGLVGPDGKPAPSRMRATSTVVDASGPALARIITKGAIHDPANDRPLARFTQEVELISGRPSLEISIELTDLDPAWLDRIAAADPWTNYLACRWAWADPQSTIRRSALLSMFPTDADRPETPDALDITSRQRRTTLLFGGLAHHRRQGGRMLDTLLVAGRESARTFQLGVTLNLEHAFPSILDFVTPPTLVPTRGGPPMSGPVGWLAQVDHKSVALARLIFAPSTNNEQGWGIIADLIETAGRAARCRLKTFRDPIHARQVNGHGEHVVDLSFDETGVSIDLTPHEIARVELTFAPLVEDPAD